MIPPQQTQGVTGSLQNLRHGDEIFRLLVDGVKDYAIFLLDPSGRVATWNQGAERIKGTELTRLSGSIFRTFIQEMLKRPSGRNVNWRSPPEKADSPMRDSASGKTGPPFGHMW